MNIKLHEGHNHLRWLKIPNRCRKSVNGLDIAVLPQNPLRQAMSHPVFAGHYSSLVPENFPKRCQVSSSLVRPPDDIMMLHQIKCASIVSRIRKSPERFPFTHKRVSTQVILLTLPRNELLEVRQNPSLQTQRDKFISTQVSYKQLYIYDPLKN